MNVNLNRISAAMLILLGFAQIESYSQPKPVIGRVQVVNDNVVAWNGERLRGGDFRVDKFDSERIRIDIEDEQETDWEDYFKDSMVASNFNVARIAVRYETWDAGRTPQEFEYGVRKAIEWCEDLGVYACINLHTNYGEFIDMPKAKAFWNYYMDQQVRGVANKDNPNVFFELSNEPIHRVNENMNNVSQNNPVNTAKLARLSGRLYNHVRDRAPSTHLILFSAAQTTHVPVGDLNAELNNGPVGQRVDDWSNASIGWHSYENNGDIEADWDHGKALRTAGFPSINTEMKSKRTAAQSPEYPSYDPNDPNSIPPSRGTHWPRLIKNLQEAETQPDDHTESWMHWSPKLNLDNATVAGNVNLLEPNIMNTRFFDELAEAEIPFWRSVGAFDNAQDIGRTGKFGIADFVGGTYDISASGADIYNNNDEFYFLSSEYAGNTELIARVESLEIEENPQSTNNWAKSGLMMRDNLKKNSKNVSIFVTRNNGVVFQHRNSNGAVTNRTGSNSYSAPYWVRLVRTGNTFTGYASANGTNWEQIGSQFVTMDNTIRSGLAVTARNDNVDVDSIVTNFSDGSTPPPPPPPPGAFRLQNVSSGKWLKQNANDVVVMAETSDIGNRTKWRKVAASGGRFYLQNVGTNDYLTYSLNDPVVQEAQIFQAEWTETATGSDFYFDNESGGTNSKRLKDFGGDAVLHPSGNLGAAVKWTLISAP